MIKKALLFMGLVFVVTVAVVLSTRLSVDALAVIIGLILGIAAGIPTTLIVLFTAMRQQQRLDRYGPPPTQQPPIVIVNGSEKAPAYPPQPVLPPPYPINGARKWTIIGEETLDD